MRSTPPSTLALLNCYGSNANLDLQKTCGVQLGLVYKTNSIWPDKAKETIVCVCVTPFFSLVLRFEINNTNNTTKVAIVGLLSALWYEEEAVDQK